MTTHEARLRIKDVLYDNKSNTFLRLARGDKKEKTNHSGNESAIGVAYVVATIIVDGIATPDSQDQRQTEADAHHCKSLQWYTLLSRQHPLAHLSVLHST